MSKKLFFLVLVLAFCLASSVHAATIIWVSDNKGNDDTDQGWIDLLEAQGYTVNLDFRNQEGRTLDAAKIDALNAADLIIISRDTDSGNYDDGDEPTQWNSIETPIILQIAHIYRSSRWLWMDSTSTSSTTDNLLAVLPDHPIFAGVTLDASNQVSVLAASSNVGDDNVDPTNNYTLIATRSDSGADGVWIAEWETGVEFYPGSGQTAGGMRMYFAAGGAEGSNVDGRYNLTAEGEQLFLNAVRYMLSASKRVKAYKPVPDDGALYEDTWVSLGWSPGDSAVSHDVYMGDNFDDVNDGAEGTFQGNQGSNMLIVGFLGFPYPDGLVPGTTYYWRIDEVNDADPNSPWKGDVWSFWIPPKKAYEPDPPDGAKFVVLDAELSWTAGFGAKLHYVYFGDNFDDVNEGVVGLPHSETTYTPGTLAKDAVYYWRVDEFDGAVTYKGDVWSFSTVPDIPITDPNLFCWWKFDVGSGTTALDWSGHDNHGTIQGDPQWVAGQVGGALQFDGDGDHVVDPDGAGYLNGLNALTVCMWIKSDVINTNKGFINGEDPDGGDNVVTMRYDSDGGSFGGTNVLKMAVTSTPGGEQQLESSSNLQVTEWQHVAMTWSDGDLIRFYVNGVEDMPSGRNDPDNAGTVSGCTKLIIGKGSKDEGATAGWDGLIDDVRIYNKVLTPDDIKEVMRGEPDLAWNPNPANGSTPYIRDATPLNWSPGDFASGHDVYFGIDRDAVADANASDTTGIYRGRQGITFYTPPEGVEWGGGPYYWRIDEYNTDATISEGRIWSFTVADHIVIEDFEDYNDYEPDRIFETWIDGWGTTTNGSTVGYPDPNFDQGEHFVEVDVVHGGSQSMPYFYENNFKYSEATLTLVSARDWTEEGVGVLSLWFYGDASNAAEPMYVALNGSAVVYHSNPDAALIEDWTEWTIDLQEFAAQGVNLANVNTISIGFGDKNNLQPGGSGLVFFDDIRLYRPAPPEPEPAP